PEWELGVQVFDQAFADAQPYDVLDATKLIPEEDVPVRIIGKMTLNRNVDNFFAETEQVAFLPTNVPPGIGFSNDPLLQGRLFSYLDTQKSRLGTTNFHQIPINAPRCPFGNFQRDGMMQTQVPKGRANYEPNSLAAHGEIGGPRESAKGYATVHAETGASETGEKLRVRSETFADHYSQARLFYRSQDAHEQAHIASSFVFELSKVGLLDQVPGRMVGNLRNVDEDLAKRVASGLNIPLPPKAKAAREPVDMAPSDKLSIHKNMKETLEGRAVGVLYADGTDAAELDGVIAAVAKAKGKAVLIAPKVGGAKLSDGSQRKADGQLAGTPSQLFDAVAIVLSDAGTKAMLKESAAVEFAMNAFGHLKAIGASDAAKPLLDKAGVVPDDGVTGLGADFITAAKKRFYDREPGVRMLA
ncbi:MAG: catalase, partial [Zymomonas sp.]